MKKSFFRFLPKMFLIFLLIAVQACEKDPDPLVLPGADGYFIVNEGGFGNSNTSISFFDREKDEVTNDVFAAANGRPLGDQAQSLTVFEGKAYIAVQNSQKVEVINADDFKSIKTITEGIESPRYFLGINSSKGYLSDWGEDGETGTVKVINLDDFSITKTIATGKGPNRMLLRDGKVYVANSGGFGLDNTISIIDTASDEVTGTITVGDNPTNMQFDKDGRLWVAGSGDFFSTKPWISRVVNNTEESRVETADFYYLPMWLAINKAGDVLYCNYNGAVYSIPTSGTPELKTVFVEKDFYGLAVDPFSDEIIGTEALDYSSAGKVFVYNSAGELQRSYVAGIAPSGVGFK